MNENKLLLMRINVFSVSLTLQEGAYTNLGEKHLTAPWQHFKMEAKSQKFNGGGVESAINLCSDWPRWHREDSNICHRQVDPRNRTDTLDEVVVFKSSG